MPYLITTTPTLDDRVSGAGRKTRRAVATLDEARDAAREALVSLDRRTFADAARATEAGQEIVDLTESGGTIGPLPDGTIIETEFVSYGNLWKEITGSKGAQPVDTAEIIDAYNNR